MVQASDAFGAWDGWVLYTSEDGHKYHWNHLTHESRWAVEQRAEDRHAEESFQAYIRQRSSTTNPDKHHRADRLDDVEAGDGDDDDTVESERCGFVTPSAGVGPIAMSVTNPDRVGRSGIAGRVSDVLRKAMESVERPRQHTVNDGSANERDPELGQKRRSKHRTSHCYHRQKGEASAADSSGNSSSSSSSSSSRSRSRSSDCSTSSGSDGVGSSSSRSGGATNLNLHACGGDNRDATRRQSGRGLLYITYHSKTGGSHSSDRRSSARGQGPREGTRRSHRSRRHGNRRKGKAEPRELESLNSRHRALTPMTAEVFAGLGRQAVGNAVRMTVRAVLGGWKGMTTAALRAVRKWQINRSLGGAVLPIAIVPSTSSKDSRPKTAPCQLQEDDTNRDSAQARPFLPNASGPPQHFQSANRFGVGTIRRVPERRDVTEGLREEEGEVGRWVGGDGGFEEQKGGFASPP